MKFYQTRMQYICLYPLVKSDVLMSWKHIHTAYQMLTLYLLLFLWRLKALIAFTWLWVIKESTLEFCCQILKMICCDLWSQLNERMNLVCNVVISSSSTWFPESLVLSIINQSVTLYKHSQLLSIEVSSSNITFIELHLLGIMCSYYEYLSST